MSEIAAKEMRIIFSIISNINEVNGRLETYMPQEISASLTAYLLNVNYMFFWYGMLC